MRRLSHKNSEVLGILGAGVLSVPHMLAATAVRPIRYVRIYSPSLSTRQDEFILGAHLPASTAIEVVRSPEQAVAALLEMSDSTLSSKDKQYLSQLIKKAQQEGR